MVEQSFFYWLALRLKDRFMHFLAHSVTGRCLAAVAAFFGGIWGRSGVRYLLLEKSALQSSFEKGALGSIFGFVDSLAAKPAKFFAPILEKSRILSFFKHFCDNLVHISLRSFGLMLLLVGGIPTAASFVTAGYVPLLMAAIAALGLPLVLLNRSFAQIYNGSFVMKKVLGFFFVEEIEDTQTIKHYLPLFALLGLAFGAISSFVDLTTFLMIFGGAIGGILVLHRTEIGIFAAAFLIPIVPTMLVLGLFAITIASFLIKVFITGKTSLKFGVLDLLVLIFAAIVAYSVIITYNLASSAPVVMVYGIFILFYFAAKNTINTREKLFAALSIIAVSGLFVAAFGIWQRLTGNFVMTEAWVDMDFFDPTMVRIYSTLENPNVLGKYLIFIVMIAFGMAYYFRDYLHKIAALGIMATAGLCLVFTQSRGAWLGVILAAAVFALLRDRRLVILGILGLIAAPFFISPEVLQRFLSIGDLADTSTNFRVSIWLGSLDMARVFWPIGIGLGTENFNVIYNLYALSAARALHSHNLYLQLLIDLGIAGLVTFVLIAVAFTKGLFVEAAKNRDGHLKTVAAVLAAAMLGYLLQGMTDNIWFNYRVLAFFWLILALGAALINTIGGKINEQI
ncbi:MAG: O-antigen ligase family protein [Defluviitaleaceae bacterium]|nr:O-antigen ligase family protein [Defluviitaleaceae bacterium]